MAEFVVEVLYPIGVWWVYYLLVFGDFGAFDVAID